MAGCTKIKLTYWHKITEQTEDDYVVQANTGWPDQVSDMLGPLRYMRYFECDDDLCGFLFCRGVV